MEIDIPLNVIALY